MTSQNTAKAVLMRGSLHFIVAIAFLTGVLAPACGFSWGGAYSVVEICTSQGIESKIVKNDDTPDAPMHDQMSDKCPFCLQHIDTKALSVASQKIDSRFYSHTYKIAALNTQLLNEALYKSHNPRGPPALI